MKHADENIEVKIKSLRDTTSPELDERIMRDTFAVLEEKKTTKPAEHQSDIWRIIMNSRITKYAAAAVLIIAVVIGYNTIANNTVTELTGPYTHTFADGSAVKLEENAKIKLYDKTDKRGFEHISGEIFVTVAKGKGEFIVSTPYGEVKALGTAFNMELLDADLKDGSERLEMLAVKVAEGTVQVSNEKGSSIIEEGQRITVEKGQAPYDFTQDENLPARLIERIQSMLDAFEAGDARGYAANYNIQALYDLAKGNINFEDHRLWFSGMSDQDAQRFIQNLSKVKNPEELAELFISSVNIKPCTLYVRSVELNDDGTHAIATCALKRDDFDRFVPKWTYFHNDWWQTDD